MGGTAAQGQTLRLNTTDIADENGWDANLSVSIADLSDIDGLWRLSYQWLRNGEAVTYTPTTTGAYTLG